MKMNTPKTLQEKLIDYYMKQIREKKVKFADIADKLPYFVYEEFMERFYEEDRKKFNKTTLPYLLAELQIATSKSTELDGDMRIIEAFDGSIGEDYVRSIEIKFKQPRYVWAIVDDPNFTEDEDLIALRTSYEEIKQVYDEFSDLLSDSEIVQIEKSSIIICEYDMFPNKLWDSYIKHIDEQY